MLKLKFTFLLMFILIGINTIQSQNIIFSEQFNGGLGTFTAGVGNPVGAVWEHSSTSTASTNGSGTINALFWGTRGPIQSATTANGCAMYNSDVYDGGGIGVGSGAFPGTHSGDLISPSINLSNASSVILKFNQYARANANAVSTLLDISTDNGATWTNFPINPTVVGNGSTTDDDVQFINISAVAGGQPNVQVRFTWTGRYYFWLIDDVEIIEQPNNNLAIIDYFYPPSAYEIPVTQTSADTFEFETTISNEGSATQTNITVKASVQDVNFNTVWTDNVNVGVLTPGASSIISFANTYIPNTLNAGDYYVTYEVESDSVDYDLSNNSLSLPFVISDSTYRMNSAVTGANRPGGGGDYSIGNIYKTSPNFATGDYRATTLEFSCAKNAADGPLDGGSVLGLLIEVSANVNDDWTNFNLNQDYAVNSDLTIAGIGTYTFPTGSSNYDIFNMNLTDFMTGSVGVDLKADTRYMLLLNWTGIDNVVFTAYGGNIDRDKISTVVYANGQWTLTGFGPDVSSVVNMNIEYNGPVVSPVIDFTNTTAMVNEDNGTVDVALAISTPNPGGIVSATVSLAPSSTATNGVDFGFSSGQVNFPAGSPGNQILSFPLLMDNIMDDGETIDIRIQSVTNGQIGVDSTMSITINDVQPLPIFAFSDDVDVDFNTPATFSALDNDSIIYTLQSYTILTQPMNGNIVINANNTAVFTPTSGVCGQDTAYYEVCDLFSCDTAMIVFNVSCPLPIVLNDDNVSVDFEGVTSFDPFLNDTLPYGIATFNVLQLPNNGLVNINTTNASYTANMDFCGTDTIIYEICDAYNCDTASILITVACPIYPLRNVNEINVTNTLGVADSIGVFCELQGTVYGIDYEGGTGLSFTLIDGTGGVNVYSMNDVNGYVVSEGDMISVKGEIDQFNGLTQIVIDSLNVMGTGTLNTPTIVTTLDETTESQLVTVEAAALIDPSQWTNASGGFDVEIRNATDTLVVRIDEDCDLFGTAAPTGWFDVTGIGGQNDPTTPHTDGYQLFPRYTSDIVLLTSVERLNLENDIQFFPNPASEFLTISSEVNITQIKILNTLGQEVKNIQNPLSQMNIDVSDLTNGIYIISFITDKGIWSEEFIKQE